jgi:RNA polymerase sigma factor (sigma-70 family)
MADGQMDGPGEVERARSSPAAAAEPLPDEVTDRELLARFAARRDESALAALLRRHGPLVLSVCRSILNDEHDAEDAFQATFLVFVRRASSLTPDGSLGSWLYGVACRVALKARALAAKRRALEMKAQPPDPSPGDSLHEAASSELRRLVHEELNRLPEKYRTPLVLCYLQGRTHAQAARELGMPRGSVAKRLSGALEHLRQRLAGRGVALSAALAVLAATSQSASAALPPALAETTLRSAATLAGNVPLQAVCSSQVAQLVQHTLRSWFWVKVKVGLGVGGVVLLGGIGGFLAWRESGEPPPPVPAPPAVIEPASSRPAPARPDWVRLPGLPRALLSASDASLSDPRPRLAVEVSQERARFGLRVLDPDRPGGVTRLTYPDDGLHNNSCLKIDGAEYLYGQAPGRWLRDDRGQLMKNIVLEPGRCWLSGADFPEGVRLSRYLRIIPGEQSQLLDTCLVLYVIENVGSERRMVGFRELLDTYIGHNDGVPFAVPGRPGLVDTMAVFERDEVPSYLQALERPDLTSPGTVAQLGLNLKDTEPVGRLVLCRWPDEVGSEVRWSWSYRPMNQPGEKPDSCVALYWPELPLAPGQRKVVGYTYGLGCVSGAAGELVADRRDQVGVTAGGAAEQDGIFTILAYVSNPLDEQTVTLRLPDGLLLLDDQKEVQKVLANARFSYAPVSWRVKATRAGQHTIEVETAPAIPKARPARVQHPVRVAPSSMFK